MNCKKLNYFESYSYNRKISFFKFTILSMFSCAQEFIFNFRSHVWFSKNYCNESYYHNILNIRRTFFTSLHRKILLLYMVCVVNQNQKN